MLKGRAIARPISLSIAPQNLDGGFRKPAIHYADTGKIAFRTSCKNVEFLPIRGYTKAKHPIRGESV